HGRRLVITRPIPLFLFGYPRLLSFAVQGLRLVGIRLVHPSSGLVLSKDPARLAIYEVCNDADEQGIEALSVEQRTVVHAWMAKGIIDNGGFRYYFEGAWTTVRCSTDSASI